MKKRNIFALLMMLTAFSMAFAQGTEQPVVTDTVTAMSQEQAFAASEPETQPSKAAVPQKQQSEPQRSIPAAAEEDLYRDGLAAYITSVNDSVTEKEARSMVDCILKQAEAYQMDEKLIMAVAQTESTYDCNAVSCANYKGLMQTGDVLAEEAGYSPEELFDPEVSIAVGAGYMDDQLETFGDLTLALAAYNQGPGAVYAGSYTTGYADLTLERMENIETFLLEEGYL